MRMMRYNPKAQHVAGKQFVVADALSRHPLNVSELENKRTVEERNFYVNEVVRSRVVSHDRLEEIREATNRDPILQEVIKFTIEIWPEHARDLPGHLRDFYLVRSNLSVAGRLLVYEKRIVIPNALKLKMLEVIHRVHQGITKYKERAKSAVWWFDMGKDIKNVK